ncbi:MAG: VOC family protein [Rhodospirillales bacterium]
MTGAPLSTLSHVSIGVNELDKALAFYDAVLATLGIRQIIEHAGEARAYGRAFPEFWVQGPLDEGQAQPGNGTHIAFMATSKAEVDAFHAAGLAAGGRCDGPPGPRAEYDAPYYGAFLRDPEGHKIEATFWDHTMEQDG